MLVVGPISKIFGNVLLQPSIHSNSWRFEHTNSDMQTQFMHSSVSWYSKSQGDTKISTWRRDHREGITTICFKSKISYCRFASHWQHGEKKLAARNWKFFAAKTDESTVQLREESVKGSEKKGTVIGAVALIIGTSIGTGILALPKRTSPAGFIPSAISLVLCWGFLLFEALLLVEINVGLLRKKRKREEENELEVISIRTMAQETLGEWGGTLATVNYIFLGYTSIVAYTSKSGEILSHLINLPASISGIMFTTFFTILISLGGTRTTDRFNQWLTASMIGLLVAIEVLAVLSGGWSGLEGNGDWGKVPATIPVLIFSLVYHDLAPVLCAYLGGDLARIRASVMLGSLVPLLALLVWEAIALGLSTNAEQVVDPVDLLMSVGWSGISVMVEAFSLLAVGTSLIGTLLGFSKFFLEQLSYLSWHSPSTQILEKQNEKCEPSALTDESKLFGLRKWWGSNKLSFTATAMVVVPSLFVSTTVPDAFSAATDIAGGYCMTMLYGVLPPAMAWAMNTRSFGGGSSSDSDDNDGEYNDQKALSRAKPALVVVGLFACGIIMEQILQDFSGLHP